MVYVNLGCSGCTLKGWSHQCLTTISLYTQISRGTWNNKQRSDGIFWRQLILWTTLPEWVRLIVWETFGVTLLVQTTRRFDFRIGKKRGITLRAMNFFQVFVFWRPDWKMAQYFLLLEVVILKMWHIQIYSAIKEFRRWRWPQQQNL